MATQSTTNNSSKSKTAAKRATTEAKKSAAKTAGATKKAAVKTAAAEKNQAQTILETAVDLPVGAVLSVSDKIGDIVEPWTSRSKAEKELRSYRRQIEKTAKRTERRGTTARRRATTEARKTRNRVEREARRHQKAATSAAGSRLKSSRDEVERRVRQVSDQFAALR
jgi:F0F1-type ATP synthase membrane subunit b/b'